MLTTLFETYLWPSLVTIALMAAAAWRFQRLWVVRRRAWAEWDKVQGLLQRRRELCPEMESLFRTFRPREPEPLKRLESARSAAAEVEGRPPADRHPSELALARAMDAMRTLMTEDPVLTGHPRGSTLLEKVTGVELELADAVNRYNVAAADYEAASHCFPNNVVLHVLDLTIPGEFKERSMKSQA